MFVHFNKIYKMHTLHLSQCWGLKFLSITSTCPQVIQCCRGRTKMNYQFYNSVIMLFLKYVWINMVAEVMWVEDIYS